MSMPLDVRVVAVLAHQRAGSDCCGAGLDLIGTMPGGSYFCRECHAACERVLSDPETIEVTNG